MSKAVTDTEFKQEVLDSKGLTVVDFWAEWCGPCKSLGPKIDAIADEYKDVKVLKMNVDENQTTPAQYSVRGIPTVLFFKDGKLVDQVVGNGPKEVFTNVIKKHQG